MSRSWSSSVLTPAISFSWQTRPQNEPALAGYIHLRVVAVVTAKLTVGNRQRHIETVAAYASIPINILLDAAQIKEPGIIPQHIQVRTKGKERAGISI